MPVVQCDSSKLVIIYLCEEMDTIEFEVWGRRKEWSFKGERLLLPVVHRKGYALLGTRKVEDIDALQGRYRLYAKYL